MRNNDRRGYKSTATLADTKESVTAGGQHNAETGLQRLHDNQDVLEDLADSDLPCAWVADALLDAVDDRGDFS